MAPTPAPGPCARCGFDATEWSHQDVVRTIGDAPDVVALAIDGSPPHLVDLVDRPEPGTGGSITEALAALVDQFDRHAAAITSRGGDVVDPTATPAPSAPTVSIPLDRIERAASQASNALRQDRPESLTAPAVSDDPSMAHAIEMVHALTHQLDAVSRLRHQGGDVVGPLHGLVAALHASSGGVPKSPLSAATVNRGGIDGDLQGNRKHHGSPHQALCLWSTEVIDALRAEGHTVTPGAAGENVTISGVEWPAVRRGLVIEIGEVRARLTEPATPCSKIGDWFLDRDSKRIDHGRAPGWSRWYASIDRGGTIRPGDRVVVRSEA